MKKKLVICASVVALALSVCLFSFSIFAAGFNFSVNNTIKFVGIDDYLVFDLTGTVTGTTIDGSEDLTRTWEYDYSKNGLEDLSWDTLPSPLVFDTESRPVSEAYILYTFTITNKSPNDKMIMVDVGDLVVKKGSNEDTEALKWQVTGADTAITTDVPRTINIKVMPKNGEFSGQRNIEFSLTFSILD